VKTGGSIPLHDRTFLGADGGPIIRQAMGVCLASDSSTSDSMMPPTPSKCVVMGRFGLPVVGFVRIIGL